MLSVGVRASTILAALSYIFCVSSAVCIFTHGARAAETDKSLLFSIFDLQVPGHCPKLTALPECPIKLADYERAFVELQRALNTFYEALDPAFTDEAWSRAEDQIVAVSKGFGGLNTKLKALTENLSAAKGNKFAAKLDETRKARVAFDSAQKSWLKDPLDKTNTISAVTTLRTAYVTGLEAAHAQAGAFGSFAGEVNIAAELSKAEAELSDLRKLLIAEDDKPGNLKQFAAEMATNFAQHRPALEAAYFKAKASAEEAVRARAELGPKPKSEPPAASKVVEILDAIYGESSLLDGVAHRWQKGATSLDVPTNASGRYCEALDYVRVRCEFDEATAEFCLHKGFLKDPGMKEPYGTCGTEPYTSPSKAQWPRIFKVPRNACAFSIRPDEICGGSNVSAASPDRYALILYRCGPSGTPLLAHAANSQKVYFLCE